ncbi:MAG TPA: ATP-binding protein [Actinomycetota bacterium]
MSGEEQRSPSLPWKRSIRAKILVVTLLPVLAGALGVGAFLVVARAQQHAEDSVRQALAVRSATQQTEQALDDLENAQSAELLGTSFGLPGGASVAEAEAAVRTSLLELRDLAATDSVLTGLLDKLGEQIIERQEATAEFADVLIKDGKLDLSAFAADPTLFLVFGAPDQTLDTIQGLSEDTLTMQTAKAEDARRRLQIVVPLLAGVGLLVGMWLALVAGRRLGRRVEEVERNAKRLAGGEQLEPVSPGRDEIGRLAVQMEEAAHLLASREAELRESVEAADRANHAKSEFLSRMSHELRTPLNSILGFGQLLAMNDGLGDEDGDSVRKILSSGRHLLGLIDEVLDVSRIEAGMLDLSLEPVDLEASVRGALDLVKPLAAERSIAIECDGGSLRGRYVTADARRLSQVLLNLLSNAIKYNVEGGTVTISATATATPDAIALRVGDTGWGIGPDQMTRLFTPFERLGAQRTGVEGTGLGLALSKRLVEAMQGTVDVQSTPGEGSTFTVTLPVAQAPAGSGEPDRAVAPPEDRSDQRVVLYIEDNLSNLKLVERLVARRSDIRLLSAMQGRLGIELARQHRPDLVLLDLHLPDLSGEEVLERLRSEKATATVPVVAISADATRRRIETLERAGVHAYLSKPFEVGRFMSMLDELLGPDPAAAEIATRPAGAA